MDSTGGGAVSHKMTNRRGLNGKVIFMAVLMVYGLALFSVAHYLKIDATTTTGNVIMQGFAYSRDAEEQLVAKIREIKSLLKTEERK